jgi:hypothetical protein
MHLYLDETTFGTSGEFLGYASFLTEKPIEIGLIETALTNLESDPARHLDQFKDQDSRTLERRYFHAADDSQNAHSHLCKAINEQVKGEFESQLFDMHTL